MKELREMKESLALRVLRRPEALRQVRESLLSLELKPAALYALTVVANELVANSIRHSDLTESDQSEAQVRCHANHVRIDICDRGTGFTSPQRSTEDGRGFPMVQGLSRHFGISRNGHTHAWAEVELA
jgi:anti-sigma regulatory factor (Ser/Thr protein kinase)